MSATVTFARCQLAALIVWGGWDDHEPGQVPGHFADILKKESFDVQVSDMHYALLRRLQAAAGSLPLRRAIGFQNSWRVVLLDDPGFGSDCDPILLPPP
ncbi:MAG: hypothetical protein IH944_07890 [Armatimonadetes bacterium]|nr:hypothetical protein [Armatimonadota bacterium]